MWLLTGEMVAASLSFHEQVLPTLRTLAIPRVGSRGHLSALMTVEVCVVQVISGLVLIAFSSLDSFRGANGTVHCLQL